MKDGTMDTSTKIKFLLKHLKPQELADKLHCSRVHVYNYLNGVHEPVRFRQKKIDTLVRKYDK